MHRAASSSFPTWNSDSRGCFWWRRRSWTQRIRVPRHNGTHPYRTWTAHSQKHDRMFDHFAHNLEPCKTARLMKAAVSQFSTLEKKTPAFSWLTPVRSSRNECISSSDLQYWQEILGDKNRIISARMKPKIAVVRPVMCHFQLACLRTEFLHDLLIGHLASLLFLSVRCLRGSVSVWSWERVYDRSRVHLRQQAEKSKYKGCPFFILTPHSWRQPIQFALHHKDVKWLYSLDVWKIDKYQM